MDAIVNYGASRFEVQRDGRRIAVFDRIEDARKFCAVDELLEACEDAYKAMWTLPEDALGDFHAPDGSYSYPYRDELAHKLELAMAKTKGDQS